MRWQLENGASFKIFFSMGKHTLLKCVQYTHKNDYGKVGGSVESKKGIDNGREWATGKQRMHGIQSNTKNPNIMEIRSSENMR